MESRPESNQPHGLLIQIDVRFALPRRLVWLLAGLIIGNLRPSDGTLEKASLILRALLDLSF